MLALVQRITCSFLMGNKSSSGHQTSHSKENCLSDEQRAIGDLFEKLSEENVLNQSNFEKFIGDACPCDALPRKLYDALHKDHSIIDRNSFTSEIKGILDIAYKTQEFQLNYYFELFLDDRECVKYEDLRKLLTTCCSFGLHVSHFNDERRCDDDDAFVKHLSKCSLQGESFKSANDVVGWFLDHQIHVFSGLNCWLHLRLANTMHRSIFHMLPVPSDQIGKILTPSILWYFCASLPPCYIRLDKKEHFDAHGDAVHVDAAAFTWNFLYDSDDHGLSLNRLKHKCFGYKSPMVTLIGFKSGVVVAAALDEPWVDSPENFGGAYCQVVELYPKYEAISAGAKIFYLKEHGRSIAKGLHLGDGKPAKIEIDSDLNEAKMIYKGHSSDEIIKVEVWGCGGTTAVLQQQNQKQWEAKEAEKRKKVKHPGDWHDNPDRSILEMGGVRVSHDQKPE